ncbi:MAG: hypothetical protein JKY37_29150 [Nannocystaceae bacterium]|nr:hypothetical protein [Nannocystaceae bacterium]
MSAPSNAEEARVLALTAINHDPADDREYALFPDGGEEHEFGWTFSYNAKAFVQTGEPGQQVPGCGTVIVARDGTTQFLGTHRPREVLLSEFASNWRQRQAGR